MAREVVEVRGFGPLRERLDSARFREALRAVVDDAFAPAVAEAQAVFPRRRGLTAQSIRTESRLKGLDVEVVFGAGVRTAHLPERGFRHPSAGFVPGVFVVEKAYRTHEAQIIRDVEANLGRVLGWT